MVIKFVTSRCYKSHELNNAFLWGQMSVPVDILIDWLVTLLIDYLLNCLIDWLISCLIDGLIDWLIDWLIHVPFENISLRQPLVVKTGSDSSTAKRSAKGVCHGQRTHYKQMPRVTVGVARWRIHTVQKPISAEHKSKFSAFIGNGDVSIWEKNSRLERKKTKFKLLAKIIVVFLTK